MDRETIKKLVEIATECQNNGLKREAVGLQRIAGRQASPTTEGEIINNWKMQNIVEKVLFSVSGLTTSQRDEIRYGIEQALAEDKE